MKWFAKRLLGKAMWVLTCVMVLVLVEGQVAGQCVEDQKLLASDGGVVEAFGGSVSISGTPGNKIAIVGAPGGLSISFRLGAAFIYRFNGASWVEETKLLASDGEVGDGFGWSVSISGTPRNEVAIVGAPSGNGRFRRTGSAFIYRFNGVSWAEEQKLFAADGVGSDAFGGSVSISGTPGNEVAIVGVPNGRGLSPASGTAYIYRFNGVSWVEEAKLLAFDGAVGDVFGRSVSIGGIPGNEVAIVGVPSDDDNDRDSGSAYIYRFSGASWVEEAKLLASEGAQIDQFGWSVSISGVPGNEVAIVGAFRDDNNNDRDSGSAYIYRFNGVSWVEKQKLLASDSAAGDVFGRSVSIGGIPGNEVAIIGARGDDDNGFSSGSAYIFRFNGVGWVEDQKLLASDGAETDLFGWSVSISGTPGNETAIVGAPRDDDSAINSGSAYIFELPCSSDCSDDLNDDGIVNVTDLLMLLGVRNPCPPPCPPGTHGHPAFNVTDLLALLAAWGPCP